MDAISNVGTQDAITTLLHDVTEMVERRGWGKPKNKISLKKRTITDKGYSFIPHRFHGENLKITKNFGCVLAGLCFTEYEYFI